MTRQRKRLQLTLSDEVWALVEEVHQLSGTPKSQVINDILEEVAPVFALQLEALRLAATAPEKARELLQRHTNESIVRLGQAHLDFDSALDARTVKGKKARRQNATS
jgi:metal-responsive CopG/Arc/MetJ family transcriptional regulator